MEYSQLRQLGTNDSAKYNAVISSTARAKCSRSTGAPIKSAALSIHIPQIKIKTTMKYSASLNESNLTSGYRSVVSERRKLGGGKKEKGRGERRKNVGR